MMGERGQSPEFRQETPFTPGERVTDIIDQLRERKSRGEVIRGSQREYTPDELAEIIIELTRGIEEQFVQYRGQVMAGIRNGSVADPDGEMQKFIQAIPSLTTTAGYRLNHLTGTDGLRQAYLETLVRDLEVLETGPLHDRRGYDASNRWSAPLSSDEKHPNNVIIQEGVLDELARRMAEERGISVEEARNLLSTPKRD